MSLPFAFFAANPDACTGFVDRLRCYPMAGHRAGRARARTRDDDHRRDDDWISQVHRIHTQGERMKMIRHPKDFVSREFRPLESLGSGILLAVLSIAVFVLALKLQLPIWPSFD
jgi:hypothetical protein